MNKLEAINKLASQLSVEQIRNLSDEAVLSMAMERPEHQGQFGFMLQLQIDRTPCGDINRADEAIAEG